MCLTLAEISPHEKYLLDGIYIHTIVSCIYAPCFATLALVESVGGACMRDLTFYLTNMPPLQGPAGLTPIYFRFSCPPETRWSKID